MISTEQAIDMLPYAVDIFEKLDIQNYVKENKVDIKGKNKTEIEAEQQKLGIKMVTYIVKNSKNVKEEFFNIVAIAEEKDVEEIKKQPLLTTINGLKEILNDKDLMSFFKSAMQ